VVAELRAQGDPANVAGMARFGIASTDTLGISVPALRAIAKRCGRDHALAVALWDSGIHEARHIAAMVEDPNTVTKKQLEAWARDLDSWDVTDGFAFFVDRTPFAYDLATKWSGDKREFVKRAAFATMAGLAVHDKKAPDEALAAFLPIIRRESGDDRNFVKKAVNWALRQIGKRNDRLLSRAIVVAREVGAQDSRSARWIAKDALRELLPKVQT
jgi:3-methyladenine DNA glycosylase AlkD